MKAVYRSASNQARQVATACSRSPILGSLSKQGRQYYKYKHNMYVIEHSLITAPTPRVVSAGKLSETRSKQSTRQKNQLKKLLFHIHRVTEFSLIKAYCPAVLTDGKYRVFRLQIAINNQDRGQQKTKGRQESARTVEGVIPHDEQGRHPQSQYVKASQ